MKVLLINPDSSLINRNWAYRKFFTPIAPLGLAYLASSLRKDGVSVSIIDQFATKITDEQVFELVRRDAPQIVGFSVLTPVVPDVCRLASGVRKIDPRITIVAGNIHSTCFPEEMLKEHIADIVVRGEGEMTMRELCRTMAQNKNFDEVSGISFRSKDEIVHNPDRPLIKDLDSLSLPAWDLFRLDDYTDVPLASINNSRALPIMASRGCSFRCYYCSQDKIYGTVRYRNLHKVVDEMDFFSGKFGIKFFGFSDAYFPFDEKTGIEFCDLVMKRGLHKRLKWCTETRVDKVSRKLLTAMKESGAHLVMYGVEVGNEKILQSVNKHTTLEQARVAFKETRRAGILSQGLFILGLPGETVKTCSDTIHFAKELDCDIVKFNIAMPYPGSRFFDDYRKLKAEHRPEKFTSWFDWASPSEDLVYTPDGISSVTLRRMQRKAMLGFYLRPKIILRHLLGGTTSFNNLLYGGLWLVQLFFSLRKAKK